MKLKDLQKSKQQPIFATMACADFYPEGAEEKYIEITVTAPFNTIVFPGEVVIISKEDYLVLIGRGE
jgi:hypothetical protein